MDLHISSITLHDINIKIYYIDSNVVTVANHDLIIAQQASTGMKIIQKELEKLI